MLRKCVVVDVAPRSPEWFAARCGLITGTCAGDMLARIKSGEAAARRELRTRLVVERLTGVSCENGYLNADMQRGIDLEPDALAAYEAATGALVDHVGFLRHPELPVGYSPDGLMNDFEGLLELKCPRASTHLGYWRHGALPSDYAAQVTHGLFVSGAQYCDFVSYDPRFPPHLQLFRVRVKASSLDLIAYELVIKTFLTEVERELAEVQALGTDAA